MMIFNLETVCKQQLKCMRVINPNGSISHLDEDFVIENFMDRIIAWMDKNMARTLSPAEIEQVAKYWYNYAKV